jgi:pimeloyl-ACP methyl ester carboxylesterase
VATTIRWSGEPLLAEGVAARMFRTSGRNVPGVLWHAVGPWAGAPLVLLGHGGTEHKSSPRMVAKARALVAAGFAATAIDGFMHGERRPAVVADPDDGEAMGAAYLPAIRTSDETACQAAESMVADWQETLDGLQGLTELRDAPVGYWGVSMGGRFGIPLLAKESRIEAAVTGLVSTNAGSYILPAAALIQTPVLFIAMWDDELFPIAGAIELFGAMPAQDRRLHVFPGPHSGIPEDEDAVAIDFLRTRLTPSSPGGEPATV